MGRYNLETPEFMAVSWLFDRWLAFHNSGVLSMPELKARMIQHTLQQHVHAQHPVYRLAIIVAYDENRGIGKNNKIPWHIPDDLKSFKIRTYGSPVIMGRNTWESLPKRSRPLPGRLNIVVSRRMENLDCADTLVVASLEHAIEVAQYAATPAHPIWIIGGGAIYQQALESETTLVDEVIATEVKGSFDCDVFFPTLAEQLWESRRIAENDHYSLVSYTRRPKSGH